MCDPTHKMDIFNNDISLKRQLVEATDAVRKKFNSVKRRHVDNQLALEKIYEPITKPLKVMSAAAEINPSTTQPPALAAPHRSRMTTPIQKIQFMEYKHESTPGRHKDNDSSDDDHGENNASQISLMDTPPSSFVTSPESESSTIHSSTTGNTVQMHTMVKNHIKNLKSGNSEYDVVYGVRVNPYARKLQMGELEIRFPGENIELWNGKNKLVTYQGSPPIYDALFLRFPPILNNDDDGNFVENFDVQTYREILKKTKAPYKNYDRKKGLNVSNSMKYRKIIKPLMSYQLTTRSHTGDGLPAKIPTMKSYNNGVIDYVYWNKPKELVDRLRLLWSSKMAGHTGRDNEILSIIEELREEGIIY